MDYIKLRAFIKKRIMEITMEWNEKTMSYLTIPDGLSDATKAMYVAFANKSQFGSLSELQSAAIRGVLEEAIGAKLPDTQSTIKDFVPLLVLVATDQNGVGYSEDIPVWMKPSGVFTSITGATKTFSSCSASYFKLPSQDDIDLIVDSCKNDKNLTLAFLGACPLKDLSSVAGFIKAADVPTAPPTLTPEALSLFDDVRNQGTDWVNILKRIAPERMEGYDEYITRRSTLFSPDPMTVFSDMGGVAILHLGGGKYYFGGKVCDVKFNLTEVFPMTGEYTLDPATLLLASASMSEEDRLSLIDESKL